MGLSPKERVLMALEHRQPDRVPLDLGGTFVTTINVSAYNCLRQALGLPGAGHLIRERTQSVYVDEDVCQALGIDVIGLYERPENPASERPGPEGTLVSEWGVKYRRRGDGHYAPAEHPLKEATLRDLDDYAWPDPLTPARFEGLAEEAEALRESAYAVVGNLGWSDIFGVAWFLRGFEQFLMDLAINKDMAHALLRRVTDFQKTRYSRFLEMAGDSVDIVLFADDVGGQEGLFISPAMYREMVKPYQAELLALIRSKTKARIMFHSCGSIVPILDDFIEIGADIINPVQVSAKGMDTAILKRRFGKRIAFWGAIDTQRVLPNGTPEDVRAEVRRRIRDLGDGGGFVVAPVHVVQADVPPENVLALCREATAHHYNGRS